MPSPLLFLLILPSLLLGGGRHPSLLASAQQVTPFLGQGTPPPGGANVYVTVGIDRLLDVDDKGYRFTLVMFVLLTWRDPRATDIFTNATANFEATGECNFYCSSLRRADTKPNFCCDGIWLPHLEIMNVVGYSEERVLRYGVRPQGDSVAWWTHVEGTFYTTMSFKAFPFDTQSLILQAAYAPAPDDPPVAFVPSSTALRTYMPRAGDDISGWTLTNVTVVPFYTNPDGLLAFTSVSAAGDPYPLHPADPAAPRFFSQLWQQGFTVIITVHRISSYFMFTSVLPLVVCVLLAFFLFFTSPLHLDTRLGVLVTLFLALVALALVVSETLPRSSEIVPTQQLATLSYVVLGIVGVEAIIVYHLANTKEKAKRQAVAASKRDFDARWQASRAAQRGPAPENPAKGGCLRWRGCLRRRGGGGKGDDAAPAGENGAGAVQVAIPPSPPPPLQPSFTHQQTMEYLQVGGGAVHVGDDPLSSDSGSEGAAAPEPAPLTAHRTRLGAAIAEARRNPGYALHVARVMDRACFWSLLILYILAVMLILALNSSYEALLVA